MAPHRPAECDWVQAALFEAHGGELPEQVQAHLAACPHCRQAQAFDRQLGDWLSAGPMPAPRGIETRIRQLRRRRRALQGAVLATAAATLLGMATIGFWKPAGSGGPPSAGVVVVPPRPVERDVVNELVVLSSPPPVVRMADEQAAWLTVLNEACEGRKQ
jgi:hypothetical protein